MQSLNGIFLLAEQTFGYQTSDDPTNSDKHLLVSGSQNMLINYQKKVQTRGGYTRLGVAATGTAYNIKNAWTWNTSNGGKLPQRNWYQNLEVWLGTVDGIVINAWTTVASIFSTTKKLRSATWYDATESMDVQTMVDGASNIKEWGGGVSVVGSLTTNIIGLTGSAPISAFSISATGTSIVTSRNSSIGASANGGIVLNSQPANGDVLTLTINTTPVTVQFVNTIGAVAGNVLIGANVAATLANLLGLLNAPGTTNTTQVAFSSGNQILIAYFTYAQSNGITKAGTSTYKDNHFYSLRNLSVTCVRTGTTYIYTCGSETQTLMQISSTVGLVVGDILIQTLITQSNSVVKGSPLSPYTNDVIFNFQNQIAIGSYNSPIVYLSKNTSYYDFTFSSPRVPGEGALFTLDAPIRAINSLGSVLVLFAGRSGIFDIQFTQTTTTFSTGSTVVTETAKVIKLMTGIDQGALNQESVIPVGNQLAYLSNETALRIINNPANLTGLQPTTFSNPIKPDFDAESWDQNSFLYWFKNVLFCNNPNTGHQYMLNFLQDADGKTFRFWNPPQTFPIGPVSVIDIGNGPALYGHSNSVAESYLLFDGHSDGQYDNMPVSAKLPINCIAKYAYDDSIFVRRRQVKIRSELKTFDEYFIDGEIIPNVIDLNWHLDYDFQGATLAIDRTINGSNENILEGVVGLNSIAQVSLGDVPNGGFLNTPPNAQKFRIVFECAKEDYFLIQPTYSTNEVDRYWAIIAQGPNSALSPRKATTIRM